MSDRKPTSFNLTAENREWLDENVGNRSEFLNDLIEHHRQGNSQMDEAVARFRKEQLMAEKAAMESRLESMENEIEAVDEQITSHSKQAQVELEEAKDALQDTPKEPDNPAIQNWAKDLGMTSEELIDELEGDQDE